MEASVSQAYSYNDKTGTYVLIGLVSLLLVGGIVAVVVCACSSSDQKKEEVVLSRAQPAATDAQPTATCIQNPRAHRMYENSRNSQFGYCNPSQKPRKHWMENMQNRMGMDHSIVQCRNALAVPSVLKRDSNCPEYNCYAKQKQICGKDLFAANRMATGPLRHASQDGFYGTKTRLGGGSTQNMCESSEHRFLKERQCKSEQFNGMIHQMSQNCSVPKSFLLNRVACNGLIR